MNQFRVCEKCLKSRTNEIITRLKKIDGNAELRVVKICVE